MRGFREADLGLHTLKSQTCAGYLALQETGVSLSRFGLGMRQSTHHMHAKLSKHLRGRGCLGQLTGSVLDNTAHHKHVRTCEHICRGNDCSGQLVEGAQ